MLSYCFFRITVEYVKLTSRPLQDRKVQAQVPNSKRYNIFPV